MYLKISKLLEILSFKLKQKALYFELKHYINSGENYLKTIYSYNRGIGKSHTLLQLAHKYKCPIIVANKVSKDYLDSLNKYHFKTPVNVIIANLESRCSGLKYNLALCQEGLDDRLISNIIKPMCEQIVGFRLIK